MALERYNDDWSRHPRREGRDWADSQRKPPATKQTGQIANLVLMIVLWGTVCGLAVIGYHLYANPYR